MSGNRRSLVQQIDDYLSQLDATEPAVPTDVAVRTVALQNVDVAEHFYAGLAGLFEMPESGGTLGKKQIVRDHLSDRGAEALHAEDEVKKYLSPREATEASILWRCALHAISAAGENWGKSIADGLFLGLTATVSICGDGWSLEDRRAHWFRDKKAPRGVFPVADMLRRCAQIYRRLKGRLESSETAIAPIEGGEVGVGLILDVQQQTCCVGKIMVNGFTQVQWQILETLWERRGSSTSEQDLAAALRLKFGWSLRNWKACFHRLKSGINARFRTSGLTPPFRMARNGRVVYSAPSPVPNKSARNHRSDKSLPKSRKRK